MNGQERTFALAKMSRGIWWATAGLSALLLAVAGALVFAAFFLEPELESEGLSPAFALMFPGFIAVVFVFVWVYYRPSGFNMAEWGLTLRWPGRSKLYPREDITSVRAVAKSEVGTPWRLWGAGGLWGLFGLCRSKHIPRFDAFISRGDGWVLIEFTDTRPLLITPADPDQFVEALRALWTSSDDGT